MAKLIYFVSLKSLHEKLKDCLLENPCKNSIIPSDMSGHVAVSRADAHQGEVEALNQEDLFNVERTNPNMSIVRVGIHQVDRPSKEIFFFWK